MHVLLGVILPFVGTAAGSAFVILMRSPPKGRGLGHFAAGIMTAASIWSLLLPAIEMGVGSRCLSILPAAAGLWAGVLFFILAEAAFRSHDQTPSGTVSRRTGLTSLAVTLHNIPEGMAVGAVYAAFLAGKIPEAAALSLSIGVAIQNIPEGSVISLPCHAAGQRRYRAFLSGVASGAVEPIAAWLTICASELIVPALPYLLGFAAGAMLFVVVTELLPASDGDHGPGGAIFFTLGFTIMMVLDVLLS